VVPAAAVTATHAAAVEAPSAAMKSTAAVEFATTPSKARTREVCAADVSHVLASFRSLVSFVLEVLPAMSNDERCAIWAIPIWAIIVAVIVIVRIAGVIARVIGAVGFASSDEASDADYTRSHYQLAHEGAIELGCHHSPP
jgi:hypothetical protein